MKILMMHPHDIYSKSEPWTIRIKSFANELAQMGHEVKLIYSPLEFFNQRVHINEYGVKIYPRKRIVGWKNLIQNMFFVKDLAEWADIIHFQKCFYHVSIPALFAGLMTKTPIHYDWDDWETAIYHFGKPPSKICGYFLNFMETHIPELVQSLSYSSEYLKNLIPEKLKKNLVLGKVPVGADKAIFEKYRDIIAVKKRHNITNQLVLYVGQLHGAQYAELFLRAAKLLIDRGVCATFMIVGDGYLRLYLEDVAKHLEISENVVFTKAVPHKYVPSYMCAADVGIACFEDNTITKSKSPLKIAEYLMAGIPVVASNVGEVVEMTNGAALLVKPGSIRKLAAGIEKVLTQKDVAQKLKKKAALQSNKYTWTISTNKLLKIYKSVLNKPLIEKKQDIFLSSQKNYATSKK